MASEEEMVAEWGVWFLMAVAAVVLRFTSQYLVRKRNFIKEVPVEDYVMICLVFIYTVAMVALFMYFEIITPIDTNNPTDYENFVLGRKLGVLNILAETAIQTTLWGNKFCLLLLYNRLTLFGHNGVLWKVVSIYTGMAYLAIMIALYGGWCRPFSDYMVLRPGNMSCLTWKEYNSLQFSMNLSTDLILLIIPVTLISRLRMKMGKKVLTLCLFSLGIFVMLAAILTKVNVFKNSIEPVWFTWSIREVSTAMLVGNLSLCMPVARSCWRFLFPRGGSSPSSKATASVTGASGVATSKRSLAATTSESRRGTASSEPAGSSWSSPARTLGHRDAEEGGLELCRKTELRDTTRRLSLEEYV